MILAKSQKVLEVQIFKTFYHLFDNVALMAFLNGILKPTQIKTFAHKIKLNLKTDHSEKIYLISVFNSRLKKLSPSAYKI